MRTRKPITAKYKCAICSMVLCEPRSLRHHLEVHEKSKEDKPINCLHCELKFEDRYSFELHYNKEHKNELNHECEVCGKRFQVISTLKEHIQLHTEPDNFKCSTCEKQCLSTYDLREHIESIHNAKYKCSLCSKVLYDAKSLRHHMRVHEKTKESVPLNCLHCDMTFEDKFGLSFHCKKEHPDGKNLECQICGKKFHIPRQLQEHMDYHNGGYSCSICSKVLVSKDGYKYHMKKHETQKANEIIQCIQCKAKFEDNFGYENHLQNVHSGQKNHECTICGKRFLRPGELRRHTEDHNHTKEHFPCEVCSLKLVQQTSLSRHLKLHEKSKVEGGIKCIYCDVFLAQDSMCLREHIARDHSEYTKLYSGKDRNCWKYKCPKCNTFVKSIPHMMEHYKRHLGEETIFKCRYCFVGFPTYMRRLHHEKHHIDEIGTITFHCWKCPKKFENAESFGEHFAIHEQQKPFCCDHCSQKFESAAVLVYHETHFHSDVIDTSAVNGISYKERRTSTLWSLFPQHTPRFKHNKLKRIAKRKKKQYGNNIKRSQIECEVNNGKDSTQVIKKPNVFGRKKTNIIKEKNITHTSLPLSVAVYQRAQVDINTAHVVWLKKTVVHIKLKGSNPITFTVYSSIKLGQTKFDSHEDFTKYLKEVSSYCSTAAERKRFTF